ncbi:MAG TPA: 50S ribosomal protein L23 [Clostridia bacterium]|nr:50S ribosomal protein L23 [Clostridia bacterium]
MAEGRDPRDIIIRPIITEKSNTLMGMGKYTFAVAPRATKTEIRNAVEAIFKVKVKDVNTSAVRGKMRRMGLSRGFKPDWKKATVTLEPGHTIKLFEGA